MYLRLEPYTNIDPEPTWLVEPQTGNNDSEESIKSTTFNPDFTYPIFGDQEVAFGYKDLEIKVK